METVRQLYAERLAAHPDAISTMARAAGWGFATHRTDQPAPSGAAGAVAGLGAGMISFAAPWLLLALPALPLLWWLLRGDPAPAAPDGFPGRHAAA